MLKTKFILAVATLAFAVSCTKSSDTVSTPDNGDSSSNIDINVSRLSGNITATEGQFVLDFGSVAKGKTSSKSITIKNDEQSPIEIAINLANGDATASFSLMSNSCPTAPTKLAVGKSCSIIIKGTGLINGTPAGTASVGSLAVNGSSYQASLKIAVTGNAGFEAATDADLIFTTTDMSSGTYTQGKSQTKSISVKNNSALGTHPGNISIAADGWVIYSSTCVAPLGPQKTCTIVMSYSKWQTESAPSIAYQASSASGAIASTPTNGAAATTCKPAASRILKAWKATDKKSEIVTTANVGSSTAPVSSLVREAVQQYSVGVANVLEVCNSDAKSVAIQLDSCASGFHKVEPKSMPGATASDFYCEPDTVTCN